MIKTSPFTRSFGEEPAMRRFVLSLAGLLCLFSVSVQAQTSVEVGFRSGFGAFGFDVGGPVPAITGFDVAYTNGDHQLRDMHIAPTGDSEYLVLLRDSSGADPIRGSVKLLEVSDLSGPYRVSRPDCVGRCNIPIPFEVPHDHALVLLGFDFHYSTEDGGPDTNIREISVIPWPENVYIEVYFGDSAGTEPYYAQVDFALLPKALFAFSEEVVSAARPIQGSQTIPRQNGRALLQAFSFRFTESDHFIRRFRVDLSRDRIGVSFYDRDVNDPYLWWLRYALLD